MRLPHRLQGQKVKSQGGAGAYCGGRLAAQLVIVVLLLQQQQRVKAVTTKLREPAASATVSVSAEYSLVSQRYHSEEEVPARHRLVVTDW